MPDDGASFYNPQTFRNTDRQVISQFVSDYPFAQLSSFDGQRIVTSHLPLLWKQSIPGNGFLIGHFAKANPQWKHANHTNVEAVFIGPHAYISSSWYETPQSVPTWNYTTVHMWGRLQLVDDAERSLQIVADLVHAMEGENQNRWSMELADDEFIEKLMQMIVAFEIEIEQIECKFKLSQNHSDERQQLVIEALLASGNPQQHAVAKLMQNNLEQ